jgi:4-amino-4-deoxy-L-arabinose transferase-like glycosyltransferase
LASYERNAEFRSNLLTKVEHLSDDLQGRQRLTPLLIFLLSLGINAAQAFLVVSPLDHDYSDMHGYIERAQRLAAGGPFFPFDSFYPPGTHYLNAVFFYFFGSLLAPKLIIAAQVLMLSLANVLAGYAAIELFGRRSWGCAVMLACALYWPFSAQGSFFMAEPALMFLLMLGLFLFARATKEVLNTRLLFFSGLTFGLGALVKSQAVLAFFAVLFALLLLRRSRRTIRCVLFLCAAFSLPVAAQFWINTHQSGTLSFHISANDAFNTYLGQTRYEAVGCLDQRQNYFYIFHNNNAGLGYRFLPPRILPVSILDRAYFRKETLALWKNNPARQLTRSLENMFELFDINPRWPLRNVKLLGTADQVFQWLLLFFVTIPALSTVAASLSSRRLRFQSFVLIFPVCGMGLVAAVSTGQPRYLLPFTYCYFLLAAPFYSRLIDAFRTRAPTAAAERGALYRELAMAATFLLFFILSGTFVKTSYLAALPLRNDSMQENYYEPLGVPAQNTAEPLLWLDLGRDNMLVSPRQNPADEAVNVSFVGFRPGTPWPRAVSWHLSAEGESSLTLRFPSSRATKLVLYLTDGNSYWRASRVVSGTTDLLAESLHDGKWLVLPISDEERAEGKKTVTFTKLTGESIALSGLAVYNENPSPK